MHTDVLSYESDGKTMRSRLFVPESEVALPGILVFPEAFGLGDHATERARRLAEAGYAALACDLHGEAEIINDMDRLMAVFQPLASDRGRIVRIANDALDQLGAQPEVDSTRIGAIGYCFGGTIALELARSGATIAGAAGFHSGLGTPDPANAARIKARILLCLGADDPLITVEQRQDLEAEMRAGGVDWRMILYGKVVHSFTNKEADSRGTPEVTRYDARADAHSWDELMRFLAEIFPQQK